MEGGGIFVAVVVEAIEVHIAGLPADDHGTASRRIGIFSRPGEETDARQTAPMGWVNFLRDQLEEMGRLMKERPRRHRENPERRVVRVDRVAYRGWGATDIWAADR